MISINKQYSTTFKLEVVKMLDKTGEKVLNVANGLSVIKQLQSKAWRIFLGGLNHLREVSAKALLWRINNYA